MMQHEFEKLYGHEVSYSDYVNIIEPMYNATELSKQDFVATLDSKRFAIPTKQEMLVPIKKQTRLLEKLIKLKCHDSYFFVRFNKLLSELDNLTQAFQKRFDLKCCFVDRNYNAIDNYALFTLITDYEEIPLNYRKKKSK